MTFNAKTKDMTEGKAKCPYCNGYFAKPEESIKNSELIKYWDFDENSSSPETIHADSTGTYNWKCSEGHKFKMKANIALEYIENGSEICPFCDDRRTPYEKSVSNLYPDLLRYWNEPELPDAIGVNSTRQHKWQCENEHIYNLSVADMIKYIFEDKEPCPYCDERLVLSEENSFKALYPELAKYWNYEANKEEQNNEGPENIFANSASTYIFTCDKGHTYRKYLPRMIYEYEHDIEFCPYCNDRRILSGFNSFKVKRPDLMKEWDEVANYFSADPDTIGERSNEIVWWNCNKGHTYKMSVIRRVIFDYRGLTACPYCKGINKKKSHSFRR